MNKVYFLSTGRSGTNFLHNFLKEYYPDTSISHQTKWSRVLNIISNLPIPIRQRTVLVKFVFINLKKQYPPLSTLDPLLSIPISLCLLDSIIDEDVKIIHLVRNPKSFVSSFINWKRNSIKKTILHHIIPFWQPTPFIYKQNLLLFNKFYHFCWIWKFKNQFFYSNFKNHSNYKLVQIEELTNSAKGVDKLKELCHFIGLPEKNISKNIISKKINPSLKKSFPNFEDLSIKKQSYLINVCGSLMKEFNYN